MAESSRTTHDATLLPRTLPLVHRRHAPCVGHRHRSERRQFHDGHPVRGRPSQSAGRGDHPQQQPAIPPSGRNPRAANRDQEFDISRYSDEGSTNQVTFVLTQSEFASLKQGDQISVQYGLGDNGNGWRFGGIDKNPLK